MWSQYYQATLSQLLRKSILMLCSENVPFDDKLEIDGIICISTSSTTDGRQIVVKVHEVVENENKKCLTSTANETLEDNGEGHHTEDDEEMFMVQNQECGLQPNVNTDFVEGNSKRKELPLAVENDTCIEYTMLGADEMKQECTASRDEFIQPISLPCKDIFPLHRRQVCSKESKRPRIDIDHDKTYSGPLHGGYSCPLCSTRYDSFSSLNSHNYNTHCRFTCRTCLNTFSMMCNLKRHERLHVGRKQYTCVQCGKGFSRNNDLRIHTLRLHRRPGLGNRYQFMDQDTKKDKSVVLGDILSKLAHRQLLKLRDREKKYAPETRVKNQVVTKVPVNESNENVVAFNPKPLESQDGVKDYSITNSDEQMQVIPTPLLTPLFSRSILKQTVRVNAIPEMPKNVIHIYPTLNSSSGGHMEEGPLPNKIKLTDLPTTSTNGEQSHYEASTVHGLSFGRIVFPNQPIIKTEIPEPPTCPEMDMTAGLPNIPFLTYSGQYPLENRADRFDSENQSKDCHSPVVIVPSNANSPTRSRTPPSMSSPSTSNRDNHTEWPAFITLDRHYFCKLCKTKWETFGSYENHHVSQHLRFPCQFCEQTFSNKNNRSRHIRSHTGQKEHICPDCGKSFSRSDTLKEHQIIHTEGYLGDQCDHCHVVIKKKAELLGHIKKCSQRQRGRHSASVSPSSSPPPPTTNPNPVSVCMLSV